MPGVRKSCIVKDPFRVQDKLAKFNIKDYTEFTDVSDSTLPLSFMKLPLVKFWCNLKKSFHNYQKTKARLSPDTSTKQQTQQMDSEAHLRI